jgi:hypothetical protein
MGALILQRRGLAALLILWEQRLVPFVGETTVIGAAL